MARYKDPIVTETLGKQLHPGEQLYHWAYGVKQPPIALIFVLMLLAILPGAIAVALLTKEYVIGLTSHRLLILRVKGGKCQVLEITEYDRRNLPPAKTSTGAIFTHIALANPQKPFEAKFHRAGMPKNRDHAMAIAAALQPPQAPPGHPPQPGYAPQPGYPPAQGYAQPGAPQAPGYPPPGYPGNHGA